MLNLLTFLLALILPPQQTASTLAPTPTPTPGYLRYQKHTHNKLSFDSVLIKQGQISKLKFFHTDQNGQKYSTIPRLKKSLESEGKTLQFATNAGIFSPNYNPLGLYIENGKKYSELNTKKGPGNFHLDPNGVFYIKDNQPTIIQTKNYTYAPKTTYALQSGPMLLIDGKINPLFQPDSSNLHLRSAVCTTSDSQLYFAITNQTTSFYEFSSFLKEELNCRNALYLDGTISEFYVPSQRDSFGTSFAAIIGLVED